jgi:hypothetical protein
MRSLLFLGLLLLQSVALFVQDTAQDYFVEAVVDNPTPFVGQQITYSFRLYDTLDLDNPLYEPSDYEGFWRAEIGPATRSVQQVNGRQYTVTEIDTVLFPSRVGELEIAPSAMVLPETVFADEQRLATNTVPVQVQPLPEGAPSGFTGAVGRFDVAASLDRQSVTLGEPITLRLTVTGSGNLEQLTPPELPVPEDWRIYDNPASYSGSINGGLLVGERTFEWLIVPSQTGSQILPEITLSYFDPETLTYNSVSTSAVTLEIFQGGSEAGQLAPSLEETLPSGGAVLAIKPVPAVIQGGNLYPGLGFWLLWLLPPGVAVLCGWWAYEQRRRQVDHVKIRQSKALQRAQVQLQAAQKDKSNDAFRLISEAIFIYFGDKLNREGKGLNQSDLQEAMGSRNIGEALTKRVIACLEWADQGRYAPVDAGNVQTLLNRTLDALSSVDAVWKTE